MGGAKGTFGKARKRTARRSEAKGVRRRAERAERVAKVGGDTGKRRKGGSAAAVEVTFPLRVAAVDVGSNAIRFHAAEFADPATWTVLESERASVRLGHDVFLTGKLTRDAMDGAVAAFARFRERMDVLGIARYRAVATSAVRESSNGERFVERVRDEAGIDLEVITGSEEARLVHLAVKSRIPIAAEPWILVDLGGGSVEVSLVDGRGIIWSESHTMGSVRLLEELAGAGQEPGRFRRLLEEYVSTLRIPSAARHRAPAGFAATGGNIEALARLAGAAPGPEGVSVVGVDALAAVIGTLSRLSYRQRVDELGLREDRADVILPAAMVYERLARLAGAAEIAVPHVGVKDGVALDLVDELATRRDHDDRQTSLLRDAAVDLGRRYMFDEGHATHVADLAVSLFDQLPALHDLDDDDRRTLMAAAILHDIGAFVSYKRHHKHSLYLISQSELPGFSEREMLVVANVARYHRKGEPDSTHEAFAALAGDEQVRVRRLAAILRLADALDREHAHRVRRLRAESGDGEVTLHLEGGGDLLLERWALEHKGEFFRREFEVKLKVTSEAGET